MPKGTPIPCENPDAHVEFIGKRGGCTLCRRQRGSESDKALYQARKDRNYYQENKQHIAEQRMLRVYSLTPDAYANLLASQGGRCALCGDEFLNSQATHIDHCHDTGTIRGILCSGCNTGLGLLGDDLDGIMRAVRYLGG